jgi:diaminohydroxyphosphoribosylaminopyrimidine deaminase / 5-amino-6-(5-phosphoribosylamino)uracil reductase
MNSVRQPASSIAQRRQDATFMQQALRLARRAVGQTSPNPMVGALLVRNGRILGRGWHHRAGQPHAEIEALNDAAHRGHSVRGATLYVTLEPCSTHGRTPPCTRAIIQAGIDRVVVGAIDPNPKHAGKGLNLLRRAGILVTNGVLAEECLNLNEAFNHWIVHHTPFVTVKSAMTLDGKVATAKGESRWITSEQSRGHGMKLRQTSDAILVGVNTVLADDPSLTLRATSAATRAGKGRIENSHLRRIILDSMARTPLTARIVCDASAHLTTIVVSRQAPKRRVSVLAKKINVLVAPSKSKSGPQHSGHMRAIHIDLRWLLRKLGSEQVTSLLVEGGGEVNASFLFGHLVQRIAFFYAPKVLGGRNSRPAVAGLGARSLSEMLNLKQVQWRRLGPDLLLEAGVEQRRK